MFKKIKLVPVALFLILVLALGLRLYKINSPLADHHSWRQADSAAVIRNLAQDNSNVFLPQWDNLIPTNLERIPNPNRYFFEDFPLAYDIYPAFLYKIFGVDLRLARLVSIAFSLGTIIFFFFLVRRLTETKTALLSAFFLAVLPFGVFFSRTIIQEPAFLFYLVSSLYFLVLWSDSSKENLKNKLALFASAILLALAFLTKIYGIFYLPLFFYLFWQKNKLAVFKNKYFYFYFLISLLPVLVWWLWLNRFPEGLPYSMWLLNEGNIRFKGAWFHWLFAERIGRMILGYWGLGLFAFGLLLKPVKEKMLFYLWLFCLLLFFVVFAKGNVTHDYYQYSFLPLAAFFLGKSTSFLLSTPSKKFFSNLAVYFFVPVFVVFMLAFSWYYVRDFYNIKGGVDIAGAAVQELTPSDSLVIAGDGVDPTLLYNTGRKGWTIGYGSFWDNTSETVLNLKEQGADYYVTTKITEIKNSLFGQFMYDNFTVVKETDQYVVFSL